MTKSNKTKYYTLPAFNRLTTNPPQQLNQLNQLRHPNLATNLATAGLFSAIAACGGSTDTNGGDVGTVTAVTFSPLVADDPINVATTVDGITGSVLVPSTRYASGDAGTTTLYIREEINVAGDLGSLTAIATGTGTGTATPTYSIVDDTFSFGNTDDGNKIATYFAIDNEGTLRLTGEPLNFGTTDIATFEDKAFSFKVQASYVVDESTTHTQDHTIIVQLGDSYIPATGSGTADEHYLSNGDDLLHIGILASSINGGAGNDIICGRNGGDFLYGNAGNDILIGGTGTGADQLQGGDGDDILYAGTGGNGVQVLIGGAGADTFVVDGAASYENGSDTIYDFNRGQGDKIVFQNTGGNLAFTTLTITPDGANGVITGYGRAEASLTLHDWNSTTDAKTLRDDDFKFVDGAFDLFG